MSASAGSAISPSSAAAAPPADTVTLKRLVDVLLFVGPSGCGKSTIINQLQHEWPDLFEFSVSHTTRQPRNGEQNGKHYHFVSVDQFHHLIDTGSMIEYSRLSSQPSMGNLYGTSKCALHKVLNNNRVVLMDTDLLGAINIRRYCAHVVVDSKPLTVPRKEKRTTPRRLPTPEPRAALLSTPATRSPRPVRVLPETPATTAKTTTSKTATATSAATADTQPVPAAEERVPPLDVPAVQLRCHSQLPEAPPVSAMPNASRLVRCMVIFIAPPSMAAVEARLRERKSETEASLQLRMALNQKWMRWAQENKSFFDYYIVNDDLEKCYKTVKRIVRTEVLPLVSAL